MTPFGAEPRPASDPLPARRLRAAATVAVWAYLLALALGPHHFLLWREWGCQLLAIGGVAAYLWVRILRERDGRPWRLGLAGWVSFFWLGNAIANAHVGPQPPALFNTLALAAYLACYPCAVAATLFLHRGRWWPTDRGSLLDALIAALALWASFTAFVLPTAVHASRVGGQPLAGVLLLPISDLLVLSMTLAAVCFGGTRPQRMSGWLLLAIGIFGLADSAYAVQFAQGSWTFGTVMDGVWVAGVAVAGLGAGAGPPASGQSQRWGLAALVVPLTGAVAAITLLAVATELPLYRPAVLLAVLAACVALLRLADTYAGLLQLTETRHQALTDDLTGLMNRRAFYRRLEELIAGPGTGELAVLLIDLDRFKEVNDQYGHAAGDRLLCDIALRLEACTPEGGLLARLGGDEFAAAIPVTARDSLEQVGRAILHTLNEPVITDRRLLRIGASIGIASYPIHARTRAELLHHADLAMYEAKRSGRGLQIHAPVSDSLQLPGSA